MHYLIDGYNLLFRVFKEENALEEQRRLLTTFLEKATKGRATLIFDSAFQLGESERSHYKTLEVIYTAHGQTADEYILEMIEKAPIPQEITVVTSDKPLGRHVRDLQAHVETIEVFFSHLLKPKKPRLPKPLLKLKAPVKKPLSDSSQEISSTPEERFDYYLKTFEKNYEALPKPKPKLSTKSLHSRKMKRKKSSLPSKQEEHSGESPEARWLRIFERALKKEEM